MVELDECNSECIVSAPCVRALMMLFNIAFWISGLTLIWIGIWMRTDFEIYLKISSNYTTIAPYVLLSIGSVVLFVASLACSCIVKIQPTMLVIYGGFLITMLYTLISLSVYIYTYKDQLLDGVKSGITHRIENYELYSSSGTNITSLDVIQNELHCCGIDSYSDWDSHKVPQSCCWLRENRCGSKSRSLFRVGCATKLRQLLNTNLTTVGVTTSAIALFPLFGTVFAFALALMGGNKVGYERIA